VQALGAEHSQPFHAYIMGIPGLKICTASSPEAAYGLTKSMVRKQHFAREVMS
jgi:pyruvate/2-oxoglutarate/acetoin dehydrogenase E1 component